MSQVLGTRQTGNLTATVTQNSATAVGPNAVVQSTTTDLELKIRHQFSVSGRDNGVNYAAQNGRAGADKAAFTLGMEPGAQYQINASGTINKGGSNVTPTSPQKGSDNTRLQIQVRKDGQLLDSLNYKPGMTIEADKYPPGSTLSGIFVDGKNQRELNDNHGAFKVSVDQLEKKSSTVNNTVVTGDAVERAGGQTTTPPAATVPSPSTEQARAPAKHALEVDGNTVKTSSGYNITANGVDGLRIGYPPGTDGQVRYVDLDWKTNQIRESDGSKLVLSDPLKNGIHNLPDGTQLKLTRAENGDITGYQIGSGERLANVDLRSGQPVTTLTPLNADGKSDAVAWRLKNTENLDALNLHHVGYGSATASDKQVGLFATRGERTIGWLEGVQKDGQLVGNTANRDALAYVNPELTPKIGTQGFQDALTNELNNNLGATAGAFAKAGVNPKDAREIAFQYLQPQREQYGQAGALNQLIQDNPWARQWFGGTPNYFNSMPEAFQSLMLMQLLLGSQSQLAIPPPQFLYV